ncbi:MAG: UDP-N-acetylmuramoyl-tripeptide--D-alanyl-D-alanine ligase [Legionellales bacterium]|nr:UDP-N-acetylmuramoyl-tripeptide--D-alanyl-D-alanine ligase [Legionellales bacterium]
MKLTRLAPIVQGECLGGDASFTQISIDTRTLQPGDLYWAIRGEQFDGHEFVAQAKAQGAVGAVVSQSVTQADFPIIQVVDTVQALGDYAHHHRQQFSLPIIALTGSCGKTTTKTLIASILQQQGPALATPGNFNNAIGVPLTLLQLCAEHRYAVIELGANHMGEIAYTAGLVHPQVALITNIGPAHIEGFGSEQGVAQAKSEIYQSLSAAGIAVLNADEPYAKQWQMQLPTSRVITFGVEQPANITAKCAAVDEVGCVTMTVTCFDTSFDVALPLPGRHNMYNALAAIAACVAIDIPLDVIKQGLQQVNSVKGRLQAHQHRSGARLIDDTYNANPRSVAAALHYMVDLPGTQKILVLGDFGELGEHTQQYHQQIGELARELAIDAVFTCGQHSQHSSQAFGENGQHFDDQSTLSTALIKRLTAETVILFKGSRSSQMENVLNAVMQQ